MKGGCEAAWFYHPVAAQVGRGKCQLQGQAATAHQQSNNTTDDRPRGKPRAASPSASKAAEWQLWQWKVIQIWMFGAYWGLFARETVLCPESPSWERMKKGPRSNGHRKRGSQVKNYILKNVPVIKDTSLIYLLIAVVSKRTIANVDQKCQDPGRKLLGSQGGTDRPVVIEHRRCDWVDFILQKVNQCCSVWHG